MQKLAVHSNPNITMKIYTHVNVEAKKAAMEALQNAYIRRDSKASLTREGGEGYRAWHHS